MPKVIEGNLIAGKHEFAIVVTRFNEFITSKLLEGALDALKRHGANMDKVTVVWVPGAVEVPLATQKLAQTGRYQSVIALGCVIRGATSHYEYVSGVLTTESIEQAIERAGTKAGNKGGEAAVTAIEMANLLEQL